MKAPECAGIIHTDFQRGFIKAEVMSFDDLKNCGTELKVKEAGGYVLAQNEETCVVYGMPKFAVEAGAVNESLSIDEMILKIKEVVTD